MQSEISDATVFYSKASNNKGYSKSNNASDWQKPSTSAKGFSTFGSKEYKKKLVCSHCGGKRHEASVCFKLHKYPEWFHILKEKKKIQANLVEYAGMSDISFSPRVLSTSNSLNRDSSILDTGASRHMTFDHTLFYHVMKPFSYPITVSLPDGS